MNKKWQVMIGLFLCGAVSSLLLQSAEAEKDKEKKKSETYTATAIVTSGVSGMVSLTITIDSYTSDEEALQLAEILKTKGPDALAKALDKTERGRIAPVGRLGNDVNVARTFQTEKGRVIRLLMNRPIGFLELRRGGRSTDYEFGIVELLLDEKGEGSGVALGAAKVKFNERNQLEVENYGTSPIRITNVHRF